MERTHILSKENSVLNQFIAELRDVNIQQESMRFRRNLTRAGEIFAYEVSKTLNYQMRNVETQLGEAEVMVHSDQIVLATILRAGLPFHQGFMNYFDTADSAFVTSFRHYSKDGSLNHNIEHTTCCDLTGKTLIIIDTMVATGASIVTSYEALAARYGEPKSLHVATVIASEDGMEYVKCHMPRQTTIWCGAVDAELTVQSLIIPGLGNAGDLAYGSKL